MSTAKACSWCASWTHTLHNGTLHWRVVRHPQPNFDAWLHLLFFPLDHVHDLLDLSPIAHRELWGLLDWARQEWKLTYYGLVIKGGSFTDHAYVEMIVGDVHAEGHAKVVVEFP